MIMSRVMLLLAAGSLVLAPMAEAKVTAKSESAAKAGEDISPLDYKPQDKDERGLWMQMDEAERALKVSPQVMRDAALNEYVRSVFCKTVGQVNCAPIRIYLMRTSQFNASMAPNGMMEVWSGLLLRTQNEAQLAAVLGHEYTHFQKRHSIKLFRDVRSKSATATWLAFTGIGLLASFGLLADIFHFSREMEHEADIGGLNLMAKAGYDTRESSKIWEQLREEMDATAASRKVKSKKDKNGGIFASHPPSAERVAYLAQEAVTQPGRPGNLGTDSYAKVMARYWPLFIDDQLKQNDFGASEYLVSSLAKEGWTSWKYFARAELYRRRGGDGDLDKAVTYFGEGIAGDGSVPELWRGRGLALLKLGRTAEGKADLGEYLKRAPGASDKAMIAMMAGG